MNKKQKEPQMFKKNKRFGWILGLMSIIALVTGIFFTQRSAKSSDMLINDTQAEFWLLSDLHFLSASLHDEGEAFQQFSESAAGKEMQYQTESVTAFVDEALKHKPTGIILTGDMTLNGEKTSAEELSTLLAPLQEAGIMVLAIPGNHEIHNGWARAFAKDKEYYADQLSADDFKDIFAEGFEKANSLDKTSLSYSINLNDSYRLFLLDSCIYDSDVNWDDPTTNGELKESTLAWLKTQLEDTKQAGQTPLIFLHHNLYAHNDLLTEGYVLDNADEALALFDAFDVPAAFSGHIHIQDIEEKEQSLTEVVTGSYSTENLGYGVLTLSKDQINYQVQTIDLNTWAVSTEQTDENLLDYTNYQSEVFSKSTDEMVREQLGSVSELSDQQISDICTFIDTLNKALFTGHDQYTAEQIQVIKSSDAYQLLTTYSYFLKQYTDSLLTDKTPDQSVTISIPLSN